jgi:hypothetical protein
MFHVANAKTGKRVYRNSRSVVAVSRLSYAIFLLVGVLSAFAVTGAAMLFWNWVPRLTKARSLGLALRPAAARRDNWQTNSYCRRGPRDDDCLVDSPFRLSQQIR